MSLNGALWDAFSIICVLLVGYIPAIKKALAAKKAGDSQSYRKSIRDMIFWCALAVLVGFILSMIGVWTHAWD